MTDPANAPRAQFSTMAASTADDWSTIVGEFIPFAQALPDRVLTHLRLLDGDFGGFPVDRLTHSLQTATRAHRDGRADEYVVMALLHDIGDTLGTYNHPDVAAAILWPFLDEENHWIVKHHGIFQGYNFFHHIGMNRDMRDRFRDHEHYEATVEFVAKYDSPAFDADYDTMPLSEFEPVLRDVMATPKNSMYLEATAG